MKFFDSKERYWLSEWRLNQEFNIIFNDFIIIFIDGRHL